MTIHEQIMNHMRGFLADCVWADVESDEFDEMSIVKIVRGIRRHYVGGVRQFIRDGYYFGSDRNWP